MIDNLLTSEQREGGKHALFDLSIGYPSIPTREYLDDHLKLWLLQSVSQNLLSQVGGWRALEPATLLEDAVSRTLRICPKYHSLINVTFSGSIALQRAIVAVQRLAEAKKKKDIHFFILEPCVDFYRSLLIEQSLLYTVIDRMGDLEEADWMSQLEEIVRKTNEQRPETMIVFLFDSPSNPQGHVATQEEMGRIDSLISKVDGLVIFDHCFAVAGVHNRHEIPLIFSTEETQADWISIWDTGKTFDLNGDKISVIISSSSNVNEFVIRALETIQVSPANRDLVFFSQFLSHPISDVLTSKLADYCLENLQYLQRSDLQEWLEVPDGGTFAILRFRTSDLSSVEARKAILERGLSVSSGASFRTGHKDSPRFIRISLARPTDIFVEAASRLLPAVWNKK
jgi:bifunctional pyridoxal-dependent enzyme with beta-cystathionase and maltose regulon repressor activities